MRMLNLKAEMLRANVFYTDIAVFLGVCEKTARNKVGGTTKMTIEEALRIKKRFFKEIDSDYLFADDGTTANAS